MSNVLYITAHPLATDQSFSLTVGQEFLNSYKQFHPNDEIVYLDLYKADIPYLDAEVFSGWEKLQTGTGFDQLTAGERLKVGRLAELGVQFLLADKYIFVTPMWNFTIPAILKTYIDAVAVPGKTFKDPKKGSAGRLKGKKAIHIQARGDLYTGTPEANLEMGHRYLEVMLKFLGVTDISGIFIEGHVQFPEKADSIKEKAIRAAKKAAEDF